MSSRFIWEPYQMKCLMLMIRIVNVYDHTNYDIFNKLVATLEKMCGRSKDSEFKYVFKALETVIEWFRVLHVSFFIVLERNLRTLWSLCYMRVSYLLGQSILVSWSNIKTTCICWLCFSIALLGTLWMFMPKDATQPNNLQAILSKATNLLLQISTQEYAIYILNTVV